MKVSLGLIKKCLLLPAIVWVLTNSTIYAQTAADSDPEAKSILQSLKTEYDGYTSLEIDFDLLLELPGQAAEKQKGSVIQQNEKYVLELNDQAIYTDGTTLWIHLKDNNEVQINDVEETEDESFLTPQDMLKIYESEDFYYAITNHEMKKGKRVTQIEFKPLKNDSEYAKMRISVNTSDNRIETMKIFSKDGSRYTLTVDRLTPNKNYKPELFIFPTDKFPGIHVEDLRF